MKTFRQPPQIPNGLAGIECSNCESQAKICDMLEVVALYMFGYFAIRCHDSKNFWAGLNCEQVLWSLFMDFAR